MEHSATGSLVWGRASYTEPSHFEDWAILRRVLGETMRGVMTRPECKLSGVGGWWMKFRVCLLGLAFVGASIVGTGTSANGNLYFSLNRVGEFDTFLVQTGTSKRLPDRHPGDKAFDPSMSKPRY